LSISREFGSGGHEIAELLSQRFELPMYDHNFLREIAKSRNLDHQELEKYDETSKKSFGTRTVRGLTSNHAENVAHLQFDYIRKMAGDGKSFIIVGRCSETVLKGNPALVSIFVLGDMENRIERIARLYNVSDTKALEMIKERDKTRKTYHNTYSHIKWGDSRNYDICINSSRMPIENTVDIIENYVKERQKLMKA
jgi:cytidylate kinase